MLPESVVDRIQANVNKPCFFKSLSPGETWKSKSMRVIPEEFVRSTPGPGAFEHRVVCSVRWGNAWLLWVDREMDGLFIIEEDWNEFVDDNFITPNNSLLFTQEDDIFLQVRIFKSNGEEIMTVPLQVESETEPVHPKPLNPHQETTTASGYAKGGTDGRSRDQASAVKSPERYLLNPANPFFVKTVTKRNDVLYVSRVAISKYGLKFGPASSTIYYLLHGEKKEAKLRFYNGSPCVNGWDSLCRRHNLKIGDSVVSELELSGGLVAAVRVHFIK